ncbi:MAG: tetratricopeptide repeat protein [Vicingaceae bacterium]
MRLNITLLIAFLFTLNFSLHAQDDPYLLFNEGNEAYKNEELSKAIDLYNQVTALDLESWELYYNLGNAYFKSGQIPEAILSYEKARKLNPSNEDLLVNLEIANLKTVDKVEAKPELPFESWWKELLNTFTIDEWAKVSIYLSLLSFLFMIAFLLSKKIVKRIAFFTALFVFPLSTVFYYLGNRQKALQVNQKYGIVFAPSVTVKSEPEDDGTRLFVIHEGTKLEVIKDEGEWSQVSLMNGNKGWVKSEVFKGI